MGLSWCKAKEDDRIVEYITDDHVLDLQALAAKYETGLNLEDIRKSPGLTTQQAKERVAKYGPNALTPPKKVPEWVKFMIHLGNPLLLLLDAAGVLSIITYAIEPAGNEIDLWLGVILFGVVLLTASMSYLTERQTSAITSAFKNMMPSKATVVRDGELSVVEAAELTLGDVVHLKPGLKVPADLRLILAAGVKIEMSSLTGESRPVSMLVDAADRESVIEARNLAFSSALVLEGEGIGVVTRIADNTYIGTIAGLASRSNDKKTTMYIEVNRFVVAITVIALVMGTILAIVGFSRKQRWQDVLANSFISIIVANVPEGLPATVTSMLAVACSTLSDKKVYVKKTEIVESLGSASVICTDKTGTLTMNLMTVDAVWCNGNLDFLRDKKAAPFPDPNSAALRGSLRGGGSLRALAVVVAPEGAAADGSAAPSAPAAPADPTDPKDVAVSVAPPAPSGGSFRRLKATYQIQRTSVELPYEDLMLIAAVNNSAKYDAGDRTMIIGDASEAALLRFCDRAGVTDFLRTSYSIVFKVPFSSATKFSAVVCEHPSFQDQHIVLLKGAPEIVLEKCTTFMHHGQVLPIDDRFRMEQKRAYEKMAGEGQRVLAFVRQIIPARDPSEYTQENFVQTGYQFVGMTGLTDPPKPGVPEAILELHEAGVRVFMVTGDHPFTAEAIGRQVNLITGPTVRDVAEARGVSVEEVDMLGDPEVRSIILPGSDIKDLSNEQWDAILAKPEIVFARTTPQQKLEIVTHVQRNGHIVAVTGDGVNDAPALKQANIGVSMGHNASDVAREAAVIILMDDHFPNITHAVEAGRLLFDNLKKTVAYTVTHLWPEAIPAILSLLFAFPLGMQPLIVLTIDLGTELGPAISLSKEDMESDLMRRPPRDLKKDRLLSFGLFSYSYLVMGLAEALAGVISYILVLNYHGLSMHHVYNTNANYWSITGGNPDFHTDDGAVVDSALQVKILKQLNAAALFNIVACQFWHIWSCRVRFESMFQRNPFRNLSLNMGVLAEIAIVVIVIWVPGVSTFFQADAPPAIGLCPNLVFALYCWIVNEMSRAARRKDRTACWFMAW